jgi:hypothetical protein
VLRRRLATWSVLVLVGVLASVAIVAALVTDDSSSPSNVSHTESTADVSLCDWKDLELSIRASGFGAHVAALRLSSGQPCDVGELHVEATVVDRNGERVPTTVGPPRRFTGQIHPEEELIASFDYSARCRQRNSAPFSATVVAAGEIGSIRATAPVAFRRDPFKTSPC